MAREWVSKFGLVFLLASVAICLLDIRVGLLAMLVYSGIGFWLFREWQMPTKVSPDEEPDKTLTILDEYCPLPFAVVSHSKLVASNERFKKRFGYHLHTITELVPEVVMEDGKCRATIFQRNYLLQIDHYSQLEKWRDCFLIFFSELGAEQAEDNTIISLIFIDNYDDVLETMEEIQRPILLAVLDRNLGNLAQQVGGVIRKYEKDKYIFIFSAEKLEYLKERRFVILDQVRELEMGNKVPLTLSIGIGMNGKMFSRSMEYAKAAMDLALGRGGDQVIVKDDEKFYFYTGKVREFGTTSKVRARVKVHALIGLIDEASNVLIMGHKNGDLDSLGAAVGVYKIVEAQGKDCGIVLDKVSEGIALLHERLTKLRVYQEDVFVSTKQALGEMREDTLLIVVDCHRPSLLESKPVFEQAQKVVVFDHHRKGTESIKEPVLEYHEPFASSTSELVTEMISHVNTIRLEKGEADALLAGITLDTKNFAFKTGAKTFEAAAFLKRNGADTIRVRVLFQDTMDSYKAKATTVNTAEIVDGKIAIAICSTDVQNSTLACAQAADDLLGISGVESSYVLYKNEDIVYISARSLGDVNVQVIMEMLGGGGHQTIAGAQLVNVSLEDAKEMTLKAIKKYLEDNQ